MSLRSGGHRVRRWLVVGFGITGRALCEYGVEHGLETMLSERRALHEDERAWLSAHDIAFEENGHTEAALAGVDAIVLSPSVVLDEPMLVEADRRCIPVFSELDVAFLVGPPKPIVAVTGTNGKSSTVMLIAELLRNVGRRVAVVGNIGEPFIGAVSRFGDAEVIVVEASSYQLEQSMCFHPRVAVLLNLEPDHLKRHKTMARYADAKGRLFRLQTPDDVAVLPRALADGFCQGSGRRVFFDDLRSLPDGAERLAPHQQANLRAALCACEALGASFDVSSLPIERIEAAIRLPHRMEAIGSMNGIRAIDDSKATNPASTVAALEAVDGPLVLLLGGEAKAGGYAALREAVARSTIRRIVTFGVAANQLADLFPSLDVVRTTDIEAAIQAGLEAARPGDTLLFSPACASFDQFTDFEARGRAFARLFRSLSGYTPA